MPSREAVINPQPSPSEITVFAPAKINVTLRILDRRPDGFHNLWSIMQTVALEDEVQIRLRADRQDIQLRCDVTQLAADQSNLVYRAAAEVLARARQSIGLDIELRKRIPMGAGLGGGSSDAAATIIGLNHLLQLEWSPAQMAEVGQSLGSDVPFFLFAPSAFVAGRGETVRPVVIEGARWVVLVNPGFGVNTKWAYQELAATRTAVTPLSLSPARTRPAITGELDSIDCRRQRMISRRRFLPRMGSFGRLNGACRLKEPRSRCCPEAGRRCLGCSQTRRARAWPRPSLE